MYELVLGKEVGQSYEGISEPDASLSEEEKKEYPSKRVRVTIHEIASSQSSPMSTTNSPSASAYPILLL